MKRGKKGKERLDKYYYLAKEQGYRARSAFKLIQLNKKFDFLSTARAVVDLGAAPGGWCQVCAKTMPVSSLIIGVDLLPIRPIPNVTTLVNDILTQQCRTAIKRELQTWKADVVLHDGAPNVGAQWTQDAYDQNLLVLSALHLATDILRPGGTFVTKVFRSRDYNAILATLAKLFKTVTVSKPAASRSTSAEVFVVCQQYLAPKHVDPALFDPKFVFDMKEQEAQLAMDSSHAAPTVLSKKAGSAHKAKGYEDTDHPLQRKIVSIVEFVETEDPLHMLATATEMSFDPLDLPAPKDGGDKTAALARETLDVITANPHTTSSIVASFSDIKILGKADFKIILRWRDAVRRAVNHHFNGAAEAAAAKAAAEKAARPLTEEEEQELLTKQLDEEAHRLARLEHRKEKKLKKRLEKIDRANIAASQGLAQDLSAGMDLFNLEKVPRSVQLNEDDDHQEGAKPQDIFEAPVDSSDSEGLGEEDVEEYDPDDPRRIARQYEGEEGVADDLMTEAELDLMYQQYKQARWSSKVQVRLDGKKKRVKVPKLTDPNAADAMVIDELPETESLLRGTGLINKDPMEGIEYDDYEGSEGDDEDDDDEDDDDDDESDEEDEDVDSEDDGETLKKKGKNNSGLTDATHTLELIAEKKRQKLLQQNALLVRPVQDEKNDEEEEEKMEKEKFETEGLSRRAEQWYGSSLFEGLNIGNNDGEDEDEDVENEVEDEDDGDNNDDEEEEEEEEEDKPYDARGGFEVPSSGDEWSDDAQFSDEEEKRRKKRHKREGLKNSSRQDRAAARARAKGNMGFEEVPVKDTVEVYSSDDEALGRGYGEDSDGENSAAHAAYLSTKRGRDRAAAAAAALGNNAPNTAKDDLPPVPEIGPKMGREKLATALAIGRKIATSSKSARERMIDDSYHRFAFDEEEDDLPEWFVDDEREHMRKMLPVTREQIEAEKERLRSIDARPAKKVLEAQAKKRLRADRRREAVRARASQIEAQEDIAPEEKAKMISKLYRKLTSKSSRRQRTVLTDARSGRRIGGAKSGRTKLVDARMKKDSRGIKRAEKKRIAGQRRRHGEVERARHRKQKK